MNSNVLHLRLETDECAILDKLAGKALNRQAVARMLLIAAIEAVEKNQGHLHFPPVLTVAEKTLTSETNYRLNEPQTTKRK